MSRPANLPASLQSWATGNYSAGPTWGGTPQRAAPGASFLTPGVSLPAENENYLHGNAFDAAQGAINCGGQLPALNIQASAALGVQLGTLAWNDVEQAWYYVLAASGQAVGRSYDYGKAWNSTSALPTAMVSVDMAFDTSGNCVVVGTTGRVQNAPPAATYGLAPTFTDRGVQVAFAGGNPTQLVYEPSNALWCVVGTTGTVISAYTSSNMTAWTARAFPATWNIAAFNPTIGVGNGLVIAVSPSAAATFRTIRSSNGGVTWTNDQSISTAGSIATINGTIPAPVWSPTDKLWYLAVNGISGGNKTIVYTSPDGITWSVAASLLTNGLAFVYIVAIGSLIIGINTDGRISASTNQGANWFKCGAMNLASPSVLGTGAAVRSGGGGFGAFSATLSIMSQRFGLPTQAV